MITIEGRNDLPEISLASGQDATPDVTEEETGSVSAIFDFSDVDTADTNAALEIRIAHAHSDAGIPSNANFAATNHNNNPTSITGEYGVFSITKNNGTGKLTVTYDLNEAASNVQSLGQGQQVYEKLTIFVYDGEGNSTPQTFTVTITGANDLPQLSLVSGQNNAPTMTEESTGTFSAEYDFSDVDANDTNASLQIKIAHAHSTSGVPATGSIGDASHTNPTSITGQYGTFTITKNNGTGKVSVTYDLDQSSSAVQGLREGATVYEKLTIFVDDGDGNSTPQTFTVSITGTNDQPVLNDITGLTIVDDPNTAANSSPADPGAIDGSLGHSDTDSGDSHEYKTTDTVAVSNSNAFRIDKTYTTVWFNKTNGDYNIIRNESEINKLGAGESVTETYTLYVEDNSGASNSASATKTLVITINGRNDKPTLGSVTNTGSVNENAAGANIGAIRFTPADEDQNQGTFIASDFTLEANGGGLTNQQVNNLFEVVSVGGGAFGLKLKSGQQLNFEDKNSYAIKVKVGDDHGGESSFVNLTVNVTNVDETDATVSIARSSGSGSAREGHVYRATVTNDLDGATAYGFQWYRDGAAISGETGQTYTLVDADGGTDLTVRISYTDASFGTKTATSNVITLPVFNSPPTGSITSNLGSQHDVGDTVTITDTIADADGIPSTGSGAKTYKFIILAIRLRLLAALEASSNKDINYTFRVRIQSYRRMLLKSRSMLS